MGQRKTDCGISLPVLNAGGDYHEQTSVPKPTHPTADTKPQKRFTGKVSRAWDA